ncbi:hypothetical protein Tco_0154581 [Tanacetum coccineum]
MVKDPTNSVGSSDLVNVNVVATVTAKMQLPLMFLGRNKQGLSDSQKTKTTPFKKIFRPRYDNAGKTPQNLATYTVQQDKEQQYPTSRFTTDVNTSVVARLPVHTSKGLTTHPEEGSPICKRFLSTEEFPNAYTKRHGVPKMVVQNVCSSRNVRMRLTTGQPSLSANLSSLSTSADQHLHTTNILRNRCMTYTNDTITLRPTKVETTITFIRLLSKTIRFTALNAFEVKLPHVLLFL